MPLDTIASLPSAPLIVGMGGTLRAGSSTERALRVALAAAEARGARTLLVTGPDLELPPYGSSQAPDPERLARVLDALRQADGVILGSPGYHGGISGLMKNAVDYIEEMSRDEVPYLSGRAVGCIATAAGWQATVTTMTALRSVAHALQGWPTPLGVAINTAEPVFDEAGGCLSPRVQAQLDMLAGQVVDFALGRVGRLRPAFSPQA
jgi:FMN reductase